MKSTLHSTTIIICFLSQFGSDAQTKLISSRKPDGLAISTGNLYFTSHDATGAAVWRTSQSAVPGQEGILYWEAGARFGDITYAKVGTAYFGYFFAEKGNVITIRRISLSGGNATVLATITNIDIANTHHNLITDGVNLYWQDVSAIRKMSINGGAVTVLDQTNPNTPTAGIDLRNDAIIYASVDKIRFVPTAGTNTTPETRTIFTASSRVTALRADLSFVYWGENNGAVRRKGSGNAQTLQSAGGGVLTSIGSNGSRFGWTQCSSSSCRLKASSGTSIAIKAEAFGFFINSSATIFWGDAGGVYRRPF